MEYHFFCQNPRCRKPLDIDETLYDIDPDMLQKEGLTGKNAVLSFRVTL